MRENFPKSLNVTLSEEGGWADHPKDPGGATMKGVTLTTLRRFKPNATKTDLRKISDTMLQKIYRTDYWDKVHGDRLAAGVDLATFDYAVNSGPGAAWKSLTAVAGGEDHVTVKRLCARRLSIYRTFRHWSTFGKGWTNRIARIEAKGVAWALAAAQDAPTVKQGLEDEAKAAGSKAKQQGAGGAATGGSTALSPEAADQVAGWILGGIILAGVMIGGWLLWRAHVNRQRRKAYEAEAAAQ
ncbi:hypothetical protein NA8A_04873 [Nitratireductor indicus C115]|uniref:TtsA-like Glycoside hydrolase family 108 domain-containing protein n=1 Tax=Nitratireductor indicus C115 TaxID=1231190 RepID=K2P7X2_9HYPH|nr:glycosyl hydrolase 108 family protein [Nitratireductor indicus]EKF43336.1 hypothetical protein NA8A_04873 [Nitratireductor indicus C115]SFQ09739.1 Lysozyme family protein [Nitratireductor indicus]